MPNKSGERHAPLVAERLCDVTQGALLALQLAQRGAQILACPDGAGEATAKFGNVTVVAIEERRAALLALAELSARQPDRAAVTEGHGQGRRESSIHSKRARARLKAADCDD